MRVALAADNRESSVSVACQPNDRALFEAKRHFSMSTLVATFELVTTTARISQGKQKASSVRETLFIALAAACLLDRLVQSVRDERLANMSSGEAHSF